MKLDTFIGTFIDTAGRLHAVELHMPQAAATGQMVDQSPVAVFVGPQTSRFYVSTILEAARHPERGPFTVENGFGDDVGVFAFAPAEVLQMARALEEAISPAIGAYRITWMPADPDLPF